MAVLGFTGTSRGMTPAQHRSVHGVLEIREGEFHHGDCVGADDEAHQLAILCGAFKLHLHPPEDEKARAFCTPFHVMHERKPYLVRNHDIVDACSLLIATPGGYNEVMRSGTWATIRYARKTGTSHVVVWPDGTQTWED